MFFGLVFFLFGVSFLVYFLVQGFDWRFPDGNWIVGVFIFQGFFPFANHYSRLKNDSYSLEWEVDRLRYFLPNRNT